MKNWMKNCCDLYSVGATGLEIGDGAAEVGAERRGEAARKGQAG